MNETHTKLERFNTISQLLLNFVFQVSYNLLKSNFREEIEGFRLLEIEQSKGILLRVYDTFLMYA